MRNTAQHKKRHGTAGTFASVLLLCVAIATALVLAFAHVEIINEVPMVVDSATYAHSTSTMPLDPLVTLGTSVATKTPVILQPTVLPKPALDTASGMGISVGQTLSSVSEAELAKRLDDIASLGITWLRFDIDWSEIQPKNSTTFQWKNIDRIVDAANARHLHLLPILLYTPGWARRDGCASPRCQPKDVNQFASFAAAAAARYSPKGIHQYEIWNEPNFAASWAPAANASEYAELLTATYDALKKVDASAIVISGGLGPTATHDGNIAPVDYLEQLYQAGAAHSFDAVGFHPYSFPVPASYKAEWNAWQQLSATSPSIRSVMNAHHDTDKRIWITEYGAPTNGPRAGADVGQYNLKGSPDHVSEALQAHIVVDAINELQKMDFAGPLFWYTYIDQGTSAQTAENFYGLVRYDRTTKPAYDALKQALTH